MNTSIITSQTNSLPRELIIKLIYYLDEETISAFATTCAFVKAFNFNAIMLPYKIINNFETRYTPHQSMTAWFKNNIRSSYINYDMTYYLKDLIDTFDTITQSNITKRIKTQRNSSYSVSTPNRHQCLRNPIQRDTHQFRIDEKPTHRRYINTKLHCILNINRFTYSHLRRNHFTVLALMY